MPAGVQEGFDLSNEVTDSQGFRHVTFRQVLNGVDVFEGSVQVHLNPQGQVVGYKANRLTEVDPDVTAVVTEAQATAAASEIHAEVVSVTVPPEVELAHFRGRDDLMHLVWLVRLFSDSDLATSHYFIDARTGVLLYQFNDMRHFAARETYTANNLESLPGELIIDQDDQSSPDAVARAAHNNAQVVADYYSQHFGRDSFDGQGAIIKSTVHYGESFNNAFWLGSFKQIIYGDGDGRQYGPLSQDLDIVAHEFTHAVNSNTARFVYTEESGALDESFADFFAIMVSNGDPVTNWLLGEQAFTPGRPGDALRDISDPPSGSQPDNVSGQRQLGPDEMPKCNNKLPDYNDNGWVHTNSGIPNKAAYLMVAGGTQAGITVEALGKSVAEQIMYLALTVYLESATFTRWTFRQARIAALDACEQLYPGDQSKLASVMNAWAAVGVGEAAPVPTPQQSTEPVREPEVETGPPPGPGPRPDTEPGPTDPVDDGNEDANDDLGWFARLVRLLARLFGLRG